MVRLRPIAAWFAIGERREFSHARLNSVPNCSENVVAHTST